jgi:hypothetical protein
VTYKYVGFGLDTGFVGHLSLTTPVIKFTVALLPIHTITRTVYSPLEHALSPLRLLSHTSPRVLASHSGHSPPWVLNYPRPAASATLDSQCCH